MRANTLNELHVFFVQFPNSLKHFIVLQNQSFNRTIIISLFQQCHQDQSLMVQDRMNRVRVLLSNFLNFVIRPGFLMQLKSNLKHFVSRLFLVQSNCLFICRTLTKRRLESNPGLLGRKPCIYSQGQDELGLGSAPRNCRANGQPTILLSLLLIVVMANDAPNPIWTQRV